MLVLAVDLEGYLPIGVLLAIAIFIAVFSLVATHLLGPRRGGPTKFIVYESGVNPVGTARRRFNVRFYILAITFLIFDVEIIFLWPWARVYYHAAKTGAMIPLEDGTAVGKGFLLASMGLFFALLVFGLLYEWKRGAFRWE